MADYPLINGRKYDHSSAEIQIQDTIYTGISAIGWDETLTPGIVRGTAAQKLARTVGEHDAEGSLSMPLEDFAELIAALGDGYMGVPFDIVANYSNEGQANTKVELLGCRITNQSGGSEAGSDPAMVEKSLDIMLIQINGLTAVPNALR